MSHYMDFDPYLIRERNEQIRDEVNSLRLKKQLRKRHNLHGLRIAAFGERGRILIGRVKLTQGPSPHNRAMINGEGSESTSAAQVVQVGYVTLRRQGSAAAPRT